MYRTHHKLRKQGHGNDEMGERGEGYIPRAQRIVMGDCDRKIPGIGKHMEILIYPDIIQKYIGSTWRRNWCFVCRNTMQSTWNLIYMSEQSIQFLCLSANSHSLCISVSIMYSLHILIEIEHPSIFQYTVCDLYTSNWRFANCAECYEVYMKL